jgi:hypothetical protein
MAYTNSTPAQYSGMQAPSAPLPPNSNGAPYTTMTTAEERMQKFAQIAGRHEINQNFAARLRQLEDYEIVFLCDDSGSMATGVGKLYLLSRFFQLHFYFYRSD